MFAAFFLPVNAQNNYLGEIKMFAGNFAPVGWALCNGQLLQISQNTALFSLLGTTYGGDGVTTFALPDLQGRFPMAAGSGTGLTVRNLGDKGGQETVTLTEAQMPSHTHTASVSADSTVATSDSPQKALPARNASATPAYGKNANTLMANTVTVGLAGGNQPHPNVPPYTCVNFIIALQGIFPSRN
ncbi:MAG TPA: tail fiber protein [Chitinivibrionales bacterium]|nr:tail fiber protein [Chitinivibrionales bacterium]